MKLVLTILGWKMIINSMKWSRFWTVFIKISLVGGWVDRWMDEIRFKDCLQQSKRLLAYTTKVYPASKGNIIKLKLKSRYPFDFPDYKLP